MFKRQEGFTLIELMVTMVLSVVVLGALYVIYAQSVAAFRIETQYLNMQERVRFGLEHLKRDMRRAGFMAHPNSQNTTAKICPTPTFPLRAATVFAGDGGSTYQPWAGANPYVKPLQMVLFGDFFHGKAFPTAGIQGNKVYFQQHPNLPGCTYSDAPAANNSSMCSNSVEFLRVFNADRYLRIVTQDQDEILLPIISANWAERSVVLADDVPRFGTSNCGIAGFGEGLEANVAGFVRYRVAVDTRITPTGPKTDLIREELQVDGSTVVVDSQLVIAEYVVDLGLYDFIFDIKGTGVPDLISLDTTTMGVADEVGGGLLGNTAGAYPENLRAVTVKLTVRSPTEDPSFTFDARTGQFEPLDGFEIDQMVGACRTLTLASRVELTSLAVRNLRRIMGGP